MTKWHCYGAWTLVFGVVSFGFMVTGARIFASDRAKIHPRVDPLEFLLPGETPARLQLQVEIDGEPVTVIWEETFAKILGFYDRDEDGKLDRTEAARLPSEFALRQVLWGRIVPYSGEAPPFADLDASGDGKVNGEELAQFFRKAGLGDVLVGVGKPPTAVQLTDALLRELDTNKDGKVDEPEWKAAAVSLSKLDKNDDELIGPGELVANTIYPGATGAILWNSPSPNNRPDSTIEELPLLVLPPRISDHHWFNEVARKRIMRNQGAIPSNAALNVGMVPSTVAWECNLGVRRNGSPQLQDQGGKLPANAFLWFATNKIRIALRADQGKLKEQMVTTRKQFTALFAESDANSDGILEEKEIAKPKAGLLRQIAISSDRNGDRNLDRKEFTDWLDLQEQITKGHVMISLLDHGRGMFEFLDGDNNGSLSVRELRLAWNRLMESGCVSSKGIERSCLPHQLRAVVSHGQPLTLLGKPVRSGPSWFLAMDRNEDGDISIREWVGNPGDFRKLDMDRDGLLSAAEAEMAQSQQGQ